MAYLLDTNICIYAINKRNENVAKMLTKVANSEILISSVVIAELEYGCAKSIHKEKSHAFMANFIAPFDQVEFDSYDAIEFGNIRAYLESQGKTIGPYDMMIAAQARSRNLVLVTNNTDEFSRVPGLKIENWTM